MNVNFTSTYVFPKIVEPPPPTTSHYAVVLHDYQLERYHHESRLEGEPWYYPLLPASPNMQAGLPETCKLVINTRVRLTDKVAGFWFTILRRAIPEILLDDAKGDWASLTHGARYITNKQGWNNGYYDPINRTNVGGEPMGYEPILTGGAIIEIIGGLRSMGGIPVCPLKAIDPFSILDPDVLNPQTHPELFYHPTVIRREALPNNTRRVNPFPQFNENTVTPIFSPGGVNYIDASRIRFLNVGEPFPNPYNPPR